MKKAIGLIFLLQVLIINVNIHINKHYQKSNC